MVESQQQAILQAPGSTLSSHGKASMLIECRFCLEELEVAVPGSKLPRDSSSSDDDDLPLNSSAFGLQDDTCSEKSPGGGYMELTPICQSKRKRKDIGNRLVRPCACKGTQQHVHVKCLCEWIGKCNKWYCTICQRVYNLSPSQLHYCVVKLQRKGALKNLPPIYSHSDFSRSSYFALLVFMGTLSMLMLPSTLPHHSIRTTTTTTTTTLAGGYSSFSISTSYSHSQSYLNSNPTSSAPLITRYPTLHTTWEAGFPFVNSQLSTFFSSCKLVTHQQYPVNYNSHILNQKVSSLVCGPNYPDDQYNNNNNNDRGGVGSGSATVNEYPEQNKPYILNIHNRPYGLTFRDLINSFCTAIPICSVGPSKSTTTI
eukprot:gene13312-15651_t